MPAAGRSNVDFGAIVAWVGGVLFVLSLALFYLAYFRWFGVPAGGAGTGTAAAAIAWNLTIFSLFALHHSVFARTGAKAWLARLAPARLERSIYVWIASLAFAATLLSWQPVPGVVWQAPPPWWIGLAALQLAGVILTGHGAHQLDTLDLAGIRQALGQPSTRPAHLVSSGLYGLVRHPVYLGWILMVWPAPTMTATRFVFAAISTTYLVLAIPIEERSLRRTFGPDYDAYARRVRWRMVPYVY